MLTKKDYYLVSLIGFSIAVFLMPIAKNAEIKFVSINWMFFIVLTISLILVSNIALYLASLINEKIKMALQIAKFVAVGGFNTLLDLSVLSFLVYLTDISDGFYFFLFKAISFTIANFFSYFWNRIWIFQSETKSDSKEFISFITVSVVGLLINASVALVVVESFGWVTFFTEKQLTIVAGIVATMFSLVWNFIGYKIFVFKK